MVHKTLTRMGLFVAALAPVCAEAQTMDDTSLKMDQYYSAFSDRLYQSHSAKTDECVVNAFIVDRKLSSGECVPVNVSQKSAGYLKKVLTDMGENAAVIHGQTEFIRPISLDEAKNVHIIDYHTAKQYIDSLPECRRELIVTTPQTLSVSNRAHI